MNDFDLIVVSIEAFPYGKAGTNRMLSYLTGIARERKVLYLCLAGPVGGDNPNRQTKGVFEGICYRYMGNPVKGAESPLLVRAWKLFLRHLKLVWLLLFVYSCKSVLLYSADSVLGLMVRGICHFRGFRSYSDVTELLGDGFSAEESAISKMKKDIAKFDGVVTISTGIYEYFDNIPDTSKFLLPVLVDMARFENVDKYGGAPYVFCCSGANLERDGLLDCLKGYLMFWENHRDFKFKIASSLNMSDAYHRDCWEIMENNPEAIEYMGPVPSFKIPVLICNAKALLLTPHKEYKTKGFPTKLGEYLASGVPTVCSSIADLTSVLGENDCYWVHPNSPDEISACLEKIIIDQDGAMAVGRHGKAFMLDNYTIDTYKERLINFLEI